MADREAQHGSPREWIVIRRMQVAHSRGATGTVQGVSGRWSMAVCFVVVVWLSGCSGETADPIDLRATTSVVESVPLPENDPNAEARQQVEDLAEQQCLDDPTADEGVIRIVEPESNEVVGEVIVDCDEVRSRVGAEEPTD